ncbi:scy1-like protein 2 [Plakobranchus ocellatus]|uniref:Scy1-like protein 2 n=1 Tax=Plakobranchus ocellatus TaxID=259542 RepID=A0AAV3YN40_9GAST|nr:scy1-like protein 2 [Plakobranchus ocellatus]
MSEPSPKKGRVGRWLDDRKKQKLQQKEQQIGELAHKPEPEDQTRGVSPQRKKEKACQRKSAAKMDMLTRLKSAVSHVIPGNPLSRDFDIYNQVASTGPALMWKVFSAVKKSTKEEASVFLFEKKQIEKHHKRDREAIVETLRRGVQQLTKLRHPRILSVIQPLEETREALAFATEPVFSSLANVLGKRENVPGTATKFLDNFTLFEVEIKHGLLQILEGLGFLHTDAKMIHRNICPSSIVLAKNGTWKLAGCEFVQQAVNASDQMPTYSCEEWHPDVPPEAQPSLDYMAPEYELTHMCSPASDMFSFGVLMFSLYHEGKPLYECNGDIKAFRNHSEELSSVRGSLLASIPSELTDHVKLLLNTEPTIRPDAAQMAKIPFFEDMACIALQYIDTLYQRENIEKSNFFKGLPKVIEHLPKRVSQQRILPALFKEGHNANMVPFVLPSIFTISEQSTKEEYCALVLPDLIPFFKLREPIQVTLMFLQNMNLLLSKTPTQQIQTYVFPLIFAALEADNSQIQELCLSIIPTFADLIEYSTLKKSLVPRIKKLCLSTSVLKVRVNCLLCLGKLMNQMDKWFVLDEILPFLREIPSREPAVLMSILGIHKVALSEAKLGITKDVMASKVLPFLIPLSIDNNLNLHQFNAYTSVIREMLTKVETEHRTKLEQLDQIQQEHKTLEISKITGENGVDEEKQHSFMDKFLSGVGLGGFTQNSAKMTKQNSAAPSVSSSPASVSTPEAKDFTPASKTLSLEEKQRLAKQQDQERILRSQKALVPRPLSSHSTSSPSAPATPLGGGGIIGGGGGGPRDLTSTLMESNMQSLTMAPKASSVNNIPGRAYNGQSGLANVGSNNMGFSSGVNWGSASSSTSLRYDTAQSSLNSSSSSIGSGGHGPLDTSSFDSLFGSSGASKPSMAMMAGNTASPARPNSVMQPQGASAGTNLMMMGQARSNVMQSTGGGMSWGSSAPMSSSAAFNSSTTSSQYGFGGGGGGGVGGGMMGFQSSPSPAWTGGTGGPVIGPRPMVAQQGLMQPQRPLQPQHQFHQQQPKPLSNQDLNDLLG